jgi:hypothetical protein
MSRIRNTATIRRMVYFYWRSRSRSADTVNFVVFVESGLWNLSTPLGDWKATENFRSPFGCPLQRFSRDSDVRYRTGIRQDAISDKFLWERTQSDKMKTRYIIDCVACISGFYIHTVHVARHRARLKQKQNIYLWGLFLFPFDRLTFIVWTSVARVVLGPTAWFKLRVKLT